jgi:GxxExxY protein
MVDLLYRDEAFQLAGLCMEIHRQLGQGYDEIIYRDALVIELKRAGIEFCREAPFQINCMGVILPHLYRADFVISGKILLVARAVDRLVDEHVRQVLNYLAAAKLELGLLVNFGSCSLEWRRVVLSRTRDKRQPAALQT